MDKSLTFIQTKQDLNQFVEAIANFKASLFKQKNPNLDQYFSVNQKQAVTDYLPQNWEELTDKKSIEVSLTKLEWDLRKIITITLQLAYQPTSNQLTNLTAWFYDNFQKQVILNIEQDSSLVGGAVIDANGKVWDYSLKQKASNFE